MDLTEAEDIKKGGKGKKKEKKGGKNTEKIYTKKIFTTQIIMMV